MKLLHDIDEAQKKPAKDIPKFNVGDTVRVHFRIVEGEKERVQVFEGVVIARKGGESPQARFTVRRVAFGEGVERVFPLHSPRVERVEVKREGQVRRAKLYYLRERSGKAARVKAKGRTTSVPGAENAVEAPAAVEGVAQMEQEIPAADTAEDTAAEAPAKKKKGKTKAKKERE